MSHTDWLYLLYELVMIVACVGMLLTFMLLLALRDVEPHSRSREGRRWGSLCASLVALIFGAIGKHVPDGLAGEALGAFLACGFFIGYPFGVLLWYLLRLKGPLPGAVSSNSRWRVP